MEEVIVERVVVVGRSHCSTAKSITAMILV